MAGGSRLSFKLLIIPAIAVAVFLFIDFGESDFEFYSVGDAFTLAVAPNTSINCKIEDILKFRLTDGTIHDAQWSTLKFNPMMKAELVTRSTSTKQVISSFVSNLQLTCDVPNTGGIKVAGIYSTIATATDPSGKEIRIYDTVSNPGKISQRTVPDNTKLELGGFSINQKTIDDKLPAGSGNYLSWVRVVITPYLEFTDQNGKISRYSGSTEMITSYQVRVLKDIPVSTVAAKGTQVSITSFSPKIFKMPLATPQTYITIKGQMDYYSSGEGMPWITITDPSGIVSQKVRFNKVTNIDNDKWSEFSLTVQIPNNPKTGTYKIQMGSDQPLRNNKPTATFEVVGADKPTTESTKKDGETTSKKCGGIGQTDCCAVSSSSAIGANSCLPLKSYVAYIVNLEGDSKVGIIPNVELFDVQILVKGTLTGESKTGQSRLAEIQLNPQIDFSGVTQKFTTSGAAFTHTYSLLVNGESKITDSPFDGRQLTIRNDMTPSNQYQISLVKVNPSEFIKKLQQNDPSFRFADGDILTFVMKVSGSMNVQIGLDKYSAVIDGMTYSYDMINSETVNDPEPCQGQQPIVDCVPPPVDDPAQCTSPFIAKLNDQGTYDCINPGATGGKCDLLTSEECAKLYEKEDQADLIKRLLEALEGKETTTGNPKGTSGTSGLCGDDRTTEECIVFWKSQLGLGSSFVVNTTLVMAVIIITIMIIVIALIIRSRRR